ncbi:MAG: class I SAM-dependent rRNA methyltransferase [Actinomycetes bacterium]
MSHSTSDHPNRVAVRITKDALRHVRSGHPWVFDASVLNVKPPGRSGDLAVVFDDRRKFAAIGLWDSDSPIRIRVLHQGAPTPIDDDFWRGLFGAALERRRELWASDTTNAYRWVHGENDGVPGLVVDRYAQVAVVKLYSSAWLPHLSSVVAALRTVAADHGVPLTAGVVRLARSVAGGSRTGDGADLADGDTLFGDVGDGVVEFVEHELVFDADVVRGQKTGHFLDQRDNRMRARDVARGKRVLDVFCCTGGFSVHAAAGGATFVHSVDLSPHAIRATERNMARNRDRPEVGACTHQTTVGDAYDVMQRMAQRGSTFDVVVVDPPSFAVRAEQVPSALKAYARLTDLAVRLLSPQGTLVQASCSARVDAPTFERVVRTSAAAAGRPLRAVRTFGHAVDHPIGFAQGDYLCAVVATA